MNKITEDMKICEVLDRSSELERILLRHGLNCAGCPGSSSETIKEAADGHGIELEKLLADLNEIE